jgi:hypothetical protein
VLGNPKTAPSMDFIHDMFVIMSESEQEPATYIYK